MSQLTIPKNYKPLLSVKETEHAIVMIKDFFQLALSTELNLTRVTAPLFVPKGTGLNDDLNGVERPVSFPVKDMNEQTMEIVHSLAKWKRVKITELGLSRGFGIYTDMNAIRADEDLDNIHSLYVDQWDWEMAVDSGDRSIEFLKETVRKIYRCLKRTEFYIYDRFPQITPILPEEITFIHAEDLLQAYPKLSVKERENEIAKKYGAVFIIGIGAPLSDGIAHDGRAPDYDDWISETGDGKRGLNGDLLVWN
ncbi:MAG: aspartate--ammonia ligase, partial [Spirochaetaceae bacterium]|nr:aspartate--ammonia ligase [Spirochaetaceae bacterium]